MKIKRPANTDKVEIQMTPMIDIVFQLLTFFVFSLKISSNEGDFAIKMPLGVAQGAVDPSFVPPITVRLLADADGNLAGIVYDNSPVSSMAELQQEVIRFVGDGSLRDTTEVELDCDANLNYEHVISAITTVSGYRDRTGKQFKLVEKIKFAPPRAE